MLRVSVLAPYVSIVEPFAAWSLYGIAFRSCCSLGGITLIAAPVSTKNYVVPSVPYVEKAASYVFAGGVLPLLPAGCLVFRLGFGAVFAGCRAIPCPGAESVMVPV